MASSRLNTLRWLRPEDPVDAFPDTSEAMIEPNGLLAIGGDLSTERLLFAYERGIFPWYQSDEPVMWWSPNPRAVLFPAEFHVSRSLQRRLRRKRFVASCDQAFADVIHSCGDIRRDSGTWITPELRDAFVLLNDQGKAHSVEIWRDDELVGGIYGLNIGGVFFGESMFSRVSDASKIALLTLTRLCRELNVGLIDCQVASPHLATLGSREISRTEFGQLLQRLTAFTEPRTWSRMPFEVTV